MIHAKVRLSFIDQNALSKAYNYLKDYEGTRGPWTATHALIKAEETGQDLV